MSEKSNDKEEIVEEKTGPAEESSASALMSKARRFAFGKPPEEAPEEAPTESVEMPQDETPVPPEISAVDLAQQALASAKEEAAQNYDKYVRAVADLENYKKRALRERADLIRYSGENLARDLVGILDDFERALQSKGATTEDLLQGVKIIRDHLDSVLDRHGIKGEDGLGASFDPTKFEAIASIPSADHAPGTVVEQLRKAYVFKDRLLRAGQVVVAVEVPAEGGPASGENSE